MCIYYPFVWSIRHPENEALKIERFCFLYGINVEHADFVLNFEGLFIISCKNLTQIRILSPLTDNFISAF